MLFINSFLEHDYPGLASKLSLVLVMWLIVLAAIVIDLFSGVRKARLAGEARTSYGFRRTVGKFIQYYSVMAFGLLFDIISSLLVGLPYFTMLASTYLVFIEARSVFEKAGDKTKARTARNLEDLATLLAGKNDIVKGVAQLLKNMSDDKSSGQGTEEQ